jgi:predicted nucleic-acid-binding protein
MQRFEAGRADFADYLIGLSNREEKAQITFTFDAKAAQSDLFATVPLDD